MFDTIVIGAGQAGLATAYHLQQVGVGYLVLNEGDEPTGSWPRYYDSLRLFSPAAFSALPGAAFPGDPNAYPLRDDVIAYLRGYAERWDLNIQHRTKVNRVVPTADGFAVHTDGGQVLHASTVVAASGAFNQPFVPTLPGQEGFEGQRLHAISYRSVDSFIGQRVVVVGAANTAVQIAVELAEVTHTTLAVRDRVRFAPQKILGKDLHFWLWLTGLDRTTWLKDQSTPVLDTGRYRRALSDGRPVQKKMFTAFTPTGVIWQDGVEEDVDVVIFATGYRPNLGYLSELAQAGGPTDARGVSKGVPGLYFVGFSGQRTFASATLRGVGADAQYVVRRLQSHL